MYEDNTTMNTNSTTVPTEIQAQIDAAIASAAKTLEQRTAAAEAAYVARVAKERTKRLEEWDRPMTLIYQVVPEWAHPYIKEPNAEYCTYDNGDAAYAPVVIELPGCTPIRVWSRDRVAFEAGTAAIDFEHEYDVWYAAVRFDAYRRSTWHLDTGECDWAVVVDSAHDNYLMLKEFEAEAARRNQEAASTPAPDPKPAQIEIPADPAAKVLACIAELDLDGDTVFERGLLYGFIALAAELRAIRTAVEDIAAVMVANDPKNQENNQ